MSITIQEWHETQRQGLILKSDGIVVPYEIFDPLVDALSGGTLSEVTHASETLLSWLTQTWYTTLRRYREAEDVEGTDEEAEEEEEDAAAAPQPVAHSPRINAVAQRDGWTCHYCSRELHQGGMVPNGLPSPQIDHKTPKSKGGPSHMDNYVLACQTCNSRKGARYTYEQFYAMTAPLRAARSETVE